MALTTLQTIELDDALAQVERGALLCDLRPAADYLEVHIPGSIGLVYEFGPGMAGRARDCIPLDIPLILLSSENANMHHAAASLRGKGFHVMAQVENALNLWADSHGKLGSTEIAEGPVPPTEPVVDVGDFGRRKHPSSLQIPIEVLWSRMEELRAKGSVTVLCGKGLRAALAVGMLERVDVSVRLWRNNDGPKGSRS